MTKKDDKPLITAKDIENLNVQIKLDMTPEVRQGQFAQDVFMGMTKDTLVMSFYNEEPLVAKKEKRGIVTARVFMPASKIKPLRDALDRQVKFYEKKFGKL